MPHTRSWIVDVPAAQSFRCGTTNDVDRSSSAPVCSWIEMLVSRQLMGVDVAPMPRLDRGCRRRLSSAVMISLKRTDDTAGLGVR